MTIGRALRSGASTLKEVSDSPALDAEVLLAFALNRTKEYLFSYQNDRLSNVAERRFTTLIQKRKNGTPIAYITGEKWFYGRPFYVDERALIPRPLTEALVGAALTFIRRSRKRRIVVADIGTGSGCIAVSIAAELRDHSPTLLKKVKLHATDISKPALAVAKKNARRHGVKRFITFLRGDILEPLRRKRLDLIVANLPYVPTQKAKNLPDPLLSLDGGGDGEALYRRLREQLRLFTSPPRVILEREG